MVIHFHLNDYCTLFFREDGQVVAKMNLVLDKAGLIAGRSLDANTDTSSMAAAAGNQAERLLQDTLATGRVGALTVDPQYLVFEPQLCKS